MALIYILICMYHNYEKNHFLLESMFCMFYNKDDIDLRLNYNKNFLIMDLYFCGNLNIISNIKQR